MSHPQNFIQTLAHDLQKRGHLTAPAPPLQPRCPKIRSSLGTSSLSRCWCQFRCDSDLMGHHILCGRASL